MADGCATLEVLAGDEAVASVCVVGRTRTRVAVHICHKNFRALHTASPIGLSTSSMSPAFQNCGRPARSF
ncbi:hypothetical protein PM082_000495 [Marasmius tenuissimus]|nr:hypothetical protein PM082_000495 [Marasmius tenuissimus]